MNTDLHTQILELLTPHTPAAHQLATTILELLTPTITPEQATAARTIFEGHDPQRRPCPHCGGIHARACPRIKTLHTRYDTTPGHHGETVETTTTYFPPGSWETDDIIFPEDVYQ